MGLRGQAPGTAQPGWRRRRPGGGGGTQHAERAILQQAGKPFGCRLWRLSPPRSQQLRQQLLQCVRGQVRVALLQLGEGQWVLGACRWIAQRRGGCKTMQRQRMQL